MMSVNRFLAVLAACLVLVAVVGCGTEGFNSVTGTVKFSDGTPLTRGLIIFSSETVSPRGSIEPDGKFTLYTGEKPGAPAGRYKVFFSNVDTADGYVPAEEEAAREAAEAAGTGLLIDRKFLSIETSGIEQEVKAGSNKFDIIVEKPGAAGAGAGGGASGEATQ
jgi:ABC-type sugar transport system substrate-binding protein